MNNYLQEIKPGVIFKNRNGEEFTIISKSDKKDSNGYSYYWNIKFNDKHGYETTRQSRDIKTGLIRNPYYPSLAGIGYVGVGKYGSKVTNEKGKIIEWYVYKRWVNMLERCYRNENSLHHKTYIDCTVDEKWHNFQNFAEWYIKQPGYDMGFELDKDLLKGESKIYSEDTCVLLPREINMMLIEKTKIVNKDKLPRGIRKTPWGKIQATAYCGTKFGYSQMFDTVDAAIAWRNNEVRQYIDNTLLKYKDILTSDIIELIRTKALAVYIVRMK